MSQPVGLELSGQLMAFWADTGAMDGAAARRRLHEAVCVLLDDRGEMLGVSCAYPAEIAALGNRSLWVYSSYLDVGAAEAVVPMERAAFEALDAAYDPESDGPEGVCLLMGERERLARPANAEWANPRFLYAGYLADGPQLRVAWFSKASWVLPDPELDEGYRMADFDAQDVVSRQDVIDFWVAEGAVEPEEGNRRASEVVLVGTTAGGELAAVSTAYLRRHPRLDMELFHYRGFVGREHRRSKLAARLAIDGRVLLSERFVSGRDRRGQGIVFEIENEVLKRHFGHAQWPQSDFTFIGETERGDHLRVHYFPGVEAPTPATPDG